MIKKTKIRSRKLGNWTDEAEKSNGRTAGKSNDDSEIRGRKLAIQNKSPRETIPYIIIFIFIELFVSS
ncbi:hypothetical protein HanXRQr2_Chr05g0215711 [Helianthus annuus]|uniref:Uncharacterized protein n=1 Tax=Helianthus annuus TaxID=4232 RepID=A0A9K3NME7_HELAN|nr:hypothetical protein HanXRQr2_Chr05g0215711 [Helianthus annuus]KAJ0922820.1 hypothetical protein HanPSC8_Chr05g0208241 [Helianthus annuus]